MSIFITDYKRMTAILCSKLSDYLVDICINEGCCEYDETDVLRLLQALDFGQFHHRLTSFLESRIKAHISHAKARFNGDLNFHRRSNIEPVFGVGRDC